MTPADSLRDIPDVSLFASDGFNFSFYVVCASDQNVDGASCNLTTSPTSGTINFTGVGGTSGGTPAFAGIMALVNQMTATRQGNANYVLYNLAAKQNYSGGTCKSGNFTDPATPAPASCVFYDITTGNNSVACTLGSPNCTGVGNGNFGLLVDSSHPTYGNPAYEAGTGYDLATGLGSINVGNLLTLWTTANLTATTTTLGTPSTTSLTSGQTFTVPVTVTGGGTGSVSLWALDSSNNILGSYGPFALSGATATASTNLLPPTTASIEAYYGGDVTHAGSLSSPKTVTVAGANQASKTTLNFVTFDSNNNPVLSTSSQTVSYGSPYILQMLVTNSSNATCLNNGNSSGTTPGSPCPKGTITLTDNGSPLKDWPIAGQLNATNIAKLNNQGMAEDQPIQLEHGQSQPSRRLHFHRR